MTTQRVLRVATIVNIVILFALFPLMFFVIIFSLNPLVDGKYSDLVFIQTFGYIVFVVFGLLALWKRMFLSIVGWLLVGIGYQLDVFSTTEGTNRACLELRQDPNCTEGEKGSMTCNHGEHAGAYGRICRNLPRQ